MTSSDPHCVLQWDIQKHLCLLSKEQYYRFAVSLGDGREADVPAATGTNEPELFEYIVGYMKSEQLQHPEDASKQDK